MPDQDLVTPAQAASAYGVTRQAVESALARSLTPPKVAATTSRTRFYDRAELHEWWLNRTTDAWVENRPPATVPTKQVNIRIPLTDVERMLAMRKPGQTLANLTAQVFAIGLEAALAAQGGK